jgi:hypothetical protein
MATNYPGALDSFTNPTATDNLSSATVPHATQHANINDAIEAIEAELGVNPSGASATVAAAIASKANSGVTISAGNGLTGGGDLTANLSLAVNYGGGGSATTVSRSDHTHLNLQSGIFSSIVLNNSGGSIFEGNGGASVATWDATGVYIGPGVYIRTLGGSETDISLSRSGTTLLINNSNAAGAGKLQTSGADNLTWDASGAYAYGKLFLRNTGGSETDGYLLRTGANVELHADNGAFTLAGAGGSIFQVTTPLGTAGIQSLTIYNRTTTGTANVIITDSARGILQRTTSLSQYKLDQQPIPADYRILNMIGKTWIDKSASEQYEGYDKRTAGFVAQDVVALSEASDGVFDPLALRDIESGELEGVAYDRVAAYLIPVVKDMADRLSTVESENAELKSRLAALEARLGA